MRLGYVILSASTVSAHAVWNNFFVNGQPKTACLRPPTNNSPITDPTSVNMRCNAGGAKGAAEICAVKPGDKVTVQMHQQPNDLSACPPKSNPAIGGRHFGPVMMYMCEVPNAKTSTGDCSWVKVAEDSYDNASKKENTWGTEILNNSCGKREVKIPTGLKAGNYLLRAEALALHSQPGQFYITCFQLSVTGDGKTKLPVGVKFPGAYKASDANTNIWQNNLTYTAPGPKVWRSVAT